MGLLKIYRCEHCNQKVVVMATEIDSVLPVEVHDDEIFTTEDVFDLKIHKSHLLNCEGLQLDWPKKKRRFLRKVNPFAFLNQKELTR